MSVAPKKQSQVPEINRLFPQAPDAEKCILAAFLVDPVRVGAICAERNVGIGHFHTPPHAVIFSHMLKLWTDGTPFNFITLTEILRGTNELEFCGGAWFITELSTFPPVGTSMIVEYIDLCEGKRLLRALIESCDTFKTRAYDEQGDPQGLVEEAMGKVCAIASAAVAVAKPKTPSEMAVDAIARAEERVDKRGLADHTMTTGIKQLDETMSGIRLGDFILISGKEKSGKTSLAFNIFEHVVFEQKKRAIAVSLEMKLPEITDRMIASMGRINFTNILNGWMTEGESIKFTTTAQKLSSGRFQIRDDLFGLTQIVAAIRQYKASNPDLELAVIDYLQLVDGDKVGKDDSREQIIAKTSRTLRRLAGELNLGMLLLVQLNEDGQVRESRAPGMDCTAHIRIEPGKTETEKWARVVYQRNGPSNAGIPVTHLGQFLRFEQGAPREIEEPEQPKKRKWHKD